MVEVSAARVDMHRLQELVRLYRVGTGVRERARLLGMSTRTERAYRQALAEAGLLEGDAEELPEAEALRTVVAVALPEPPPRPISRKVDRWLPEIRRGVEKGAGPQAIWDKLRREDPDFGASVSAVKRAVRRIRREQGPRPEDIAIPVETAPGEVAQVDFGFAGWFFDPQTGLVRKAWLFVMVLGFSRHMFAKLVLSQKCLTWIDVHVEAFRWFGGVPRTVVPDNLRAAVTRAAFGSADRHLLGLNRSYRELGRHYGFLVDPTPPGEPRKKGKVESCVKYATRNFLAAGDFHTIADANDALPDWLRSTAGMRVHGSTGRRPLELFELERPALRPLPTTPYEIVEWKPATVHPDSHVEFDRRLYSVPWPHTGMRVWIKATPTSVFVYSDDIRIATHARRTDGRLSTVLSHLPTHRAELAQRSEQYWLERADALDVAVGAFVRKVIASDDVLSKLRDVQAIVTHLEHFPVRRARCACQRADYFGNYTYTGVRRILAEALDLLPLPEEHQKPAAHPSKPRFARSASEFAVANKKEDDERQ